jgi:hypothetical protein
MNDLRLRIIAGLEEIAMLESEAQRLCWRVLKQAIADLAGGSKDRMPPGCAPEYFFEQGLHVFFCVAVMINPNGVLRLLRAAGLLESRR